MEAWLGDTPPHLEVLIIYIIATKQATTDWYLVNSLLQDSEEIGASTRQ